MKNTARPELPLAPYQTDDNTPLSYVTDWLEQMWMDSKEYNEILRAHLEALEPECRWCFAIDMERVKGEVIAQYDFEDGMVLHLACPRCGGEWSEYIRVFTGEYLRDRIYRLHPEFEGKKVDQEFEEAVQRLWPEHPDGPPKLYRVGLAPEN